MDKVKAKHNWARTPNGVRCSRCHVPKQAGAPACFERSFHAKLVDRLIETTATKLVEPGTGDTPETLLDRISGYLEPNRRLTNREVFFSPTRRQNYEPMDDAQKALRREAQKAARNLKALTPGQPTNVKLTGMPIESVDFTTLQQAK